MVDTVATILLTWVQQGPRGVDGLRPGPRLARREAVGGRGGGDGGHLGENMVTHRAHVCVTVISVTISMMGEGGRPPVFSPPPRSRLDILARAPSCLPGPALRSSEAVGLGMESYST